MVRGGNQRPPRYSEIAPQCCSISTCMTGLNVNPRRDDDLDADQCATACHLRYWARLKNVTFFALTTRLAALI